jgi:hypothetical protein
MKESIKISASFRVSGQKVTREIIFEPPSKMQNLQGGRIRYTEGDIGISILVLKHFLGQHAPREYLDVQGGGCSEEISWEDGPYFDNKTKYVLYLYQKEVKEDIKAFAKRNYNLDEAASEVYYADNLGILTLPTVAVMHGWSRGDNRNSVLQNRGFNGSPSLDGESSFLVNL